MSFGELASGRYAGSLIAAPGRIRGTAAGIGRISGSDGFGGRRNYGFCCRRRGWRRFRRSCSGGRSLAGRLCGRRLGSPPATELGEVHGFGARRVLAEFVFLFLAELLVLRSQ